MTQQYDLAAAFVAALTGDPETVMLSVKDLSERFGIPVATIWTGIYEKRIPLIPTSVKPRLYAISDVEAWENSNPVFLRRGRVVDGKRQCNKCDNWLDLTHFQNGEKYSLVCSECRKKPHATYRKKNPDKTSRWSKKYRSNPSNCAVQLLSRAKSRDCSSDLLRSDIASKIGVGCNLSGIPFDFSASGYGNRSAFSPSIDRINNDDGYTVKNTQVIGVMLNIGKNEWPQIDFIAMCCAVAERHSQEPAVIQRLKELRSAEF